MGDLLLAIDCGTQSVRALLFDARGNLVARQREAFDDYVYAEPGWMEHDGDAFFAAAARCCRALDPALRARVAGIGVTTQRGTIVPVDEAGRCLAKAIVWMDQRRATKLPPLPWYWRAAFAAAGVADTVNTLQRDAEVNWWAEHAPELHGRAHKFLLVSGLLHHRLTGRFADSVGSQVSYLPFDYKRQRWAGRADWKWAAVAARADQLPELVPVGATIGGLTRAAAEATGLAEGAPVIAAAADKACEILGSGALAPDVGALSYGTTATINLTSPDYLEPMAYVPPYPSAVPGHYSVEVQIFRGFWLVSWFREQFGQLERMAAEQQGVPAEKLFDEMIAPIPPGSLGLVLLPTWSPGIRVPGPEAKGAVIGFGDMHGRAHLYRAILEGLAYGLREAGEGLEKRARLRLRELRVSGGGAQSDEAMQITADVFGLRAGRPHTHETSGLGAAIDVAVGLGVHRDFTAAVGEMTRVERWFEPRADAAATYDQLYRKVYLPLYGKLAPLFEEIRAITGYPAR